MNTEPFTILRHSTNASQNPIVDICGVYLSNADAIKLRDELNRLLPIAEPNKTSAPWIEPVGVLNGPIMDEDDARKHDQKQANATLEHNIACMVSDYENGNIAGGRLRWAAIKADLRGLS